jgi:hypothetical protein
LGGIELVVVGVAGDQGAPGLRAAFDLDDAVVSVVASEGGGGVAGAQVLGGGPLPVRLLAAHFGEVRDAVGGGAAAEGGAGFDGL